MQFQTRYIKEVVRQANAHEVNRGKAWYPRAYKWCELVGRKHNASAETVAGVLAALSPQTSWTYNLRITRVFFETRGAISGQTLANTNKARKILDGSAPLDVLGGPKVRAFYGSIIGQPTALCLDRHAYSLACGRVLSDLELAKMFSGKARQQRAFNAYQRAAEYYGLELRELQAITWLTWRRIKKLN